MKINYLSIIIGSLFLIVAEANGQPGGPPRGQDNRKERIEAMKVGFLTDKLQLTPDEAKAFWPVYDQYQNELEKLRKDRRSNLKNAKENMDEMSDAEIEKAVDSELAFRQAELDLVKKYNPQFKKVLPIRKVGRLYRAEEEFKVELLRQLKDKRDDNGPGRGPRGGR